MKTRNQMKTEIADLQEKLQEMQEKAIEAYLYTCPNLSDRLCMMPEFKYCSGREGSFNCNYMQDFINQLNNK